MRAMNGDLRQNIALIGLPGCGKSTVGALLAEALQWTLVDTDIILAQHTGLTKTAMMAAHGEQYVRALEAAIIMRACKLSSVVITPSSGVVLLVDTITVLQRSAQVVYLKRSCESILSNGVYTGKAHRTEAERIYRLDAQRSTLYEKFSDIAVENECECDKAVSEIMALLRCSECFPF